MNGLSRRWVILGAFALAACQTTPPEMSMDRVLTNAYDGNYEIVVSRLWNDIPSNLADPFYQTEPETLATLTAIVERGRFTVSSVENRTAANAYDDFNAAFFDGGVLELSTTIGYLLGAGKTDSYRLQTAATIGDQLLSGNAVSFEPNARFSIEYSPHISIRKVN